LLLFVAITVIVMQAGAVLGQITFGATLTVIRGTVSVVHGDGSAVAPAPSGLTLNNGDRVATIGRASALVTFFDGSEVELGGDTTIAIQDATGGNNGLVSIIIETVLGSTVHHVATLTNPGSTYKIVAGDTVTLVKGTTVGNSHDSDGNVTAYLIDSTNAVTFPDEGHLLHNGEACTLTSAFDLNCEQVKGKDVWSTLAEGVHPSGGNGSDKPGLSNSSKPSNEKDLKPPPEPTATATTTPTPEGRQQPR
jgi:hypothetical protein